MPEAEALRAADSPRAVELARLIAAAPHRLPFLAGVAAVMLSMAWWAWSLAAARFGTAAPAAPIPAGWGHAISMQYHVLALFVFGFLLTVMPRWTSQPLFGARHYVPAAGLLLLGYVATLLGLSGSATLLHLGAVATIGAWLLALVLLGRVVWRDAGAEYHALSAYLALALGGVGLVLYARYLHGGDARFMFAAIKFGTFAFLLPMYVTVGHRMIPFFTSCVVRGYAVHRPPAWLAAFWLLVLAHLMLELSHAYAWLWLADVPLAAMTAWIWLRWQPLRARASGLLAVLYLAFAWLPLSFALYALQSGWFAATGDFVLGRAPVHALAIGYFGSMLVAMVTRVTQGHSGRPLQMGGVAWFAFATIQLVALLRIAAEFAADAPLWQFVAALGWLAAFAPWAIRSAAIYLAPRVDGKPG